MAQIEVVNDDVSLTEPTLVEGLPGVGLVGKIAADHLVSTFEMDHYANVYCEGIPKAVTYHEDNNQLVTPVRLYVNTDRDLLALQSDIPISPQAAITFADCVSEWFDSESILPVYLSGIPREKGSEPADVYGIGINRGIDRLDSLEIPSPNERGLVSGPTGALLAHALEHDQSAIGLVVESDPRFPDPEAASQLLKQGIEPLANISVSTDHLVDRAEEIRKAREQLAQQMQQADEESTRVQPLRMYQ